MAKENIKKYMINEYLANFSKKRNIDSTFIKWFSKTDATNPKKTKEEWDNLYKDFLKDK